jgi:hypothetical protein
MIWLFAPQKLSTAARKTPVRATGGMMIASPKRDFNATKRTDATPALDVYV